MKTTGIEEYEQARNNARTLYNYGCISPQELPLLNAAIDDCFGGDEPPYPHAIGVVAAAILGRAHRMCSLHEIDGSPRPPEEVGGKQLPRIPVENLERIAKIDLMDYFFY